MERQGSTAQMSWWTLCPTQSTRDAQGVRAGLVIYSGASSTAGK
ncbi:MAG TPA: hypothetical protein VGO93_07825 [Candidatus Xenobia bacterium]